MMTRDSEVKKYADFIAMEFRGYAATLKLAGIKLTDAHPHYGKNCAIFPRNDTDKAVSALLACGFSLLEQNHEYLAFGKNDKGVLFLNINDGAPLDAGDECRFSVYKSTKEPSIIDRICSRYIVRAVNDDKTFKATLKDVEANCNKICENLYTYVDSGDIMYVSVYPECNRIIVDTRPQPAYEELA